MAASVFIPNELTPTYIKTDVVQLSFDNIENDVSATPLFLLEGSNKTIEQTHHVIRQHSLPEIYLSPIIWVQNDSSTVDNQLQHAMDLVVEQNTDYDTEQLLSRVEPINRRIKQITAQQPATAIKTLDQRILQFMYVRQLSLDPEETIVHHSGFHYPLLKGLVANADNTLLKVLESMQSEHLLESEFVSKSHCCTRCQSAFLNFIEVCPGCAHADLQMDDLVHHFNCAYVGEQSEFQQDDKMVCPKCDKQLKHIGVDYDKPSSVFHCKQCQQVFQEPDLKTRCYNCRSEAAPEDLTLRTIQRYKQTSLGAHVAVHGVSDTLAGGIVGNDQCLDFDVFKKFLSVEIARIERNALMQTTLLQIHLTDVEDLDERFGERSNEVFTELGQILQETLRSSDLLTMVSNGFYFVMLADTDEDNARHVCQLLVDQIKLLFKNNLKIDALPLVGIQQIHPFDTVDDLLSQVAINHEFV